MDIAMNLPDMKEHRKPFREWLLNVCGYEIWPPTHNDPTIKGPRPRIITKRQAAALRAMAEINDGDGTIPDSLNTVRRSCMNSGGMACPC